ncbi:MAG: cupin domain-containing protein [Oscillospiraceae bacterium]|jgi:transcriptional regulator with XRE-family HTH domain|nr:cupin domain-containing protein [Oscillospiraceae bacterium]
MNNNWLQIPKRIRELREVLEIPQESLAQALRVPLGDYIAMENGEKDIPISLLYNIAEELGTDFTVLSTGEEPRMNQYTVVRRGEGDRFDRFAGYHFEGLADNFQSRVMKPMLVTLEAEEPDPEQVVHSGQEFNYVLEGEILLRLSSSKIKLNVGDSVYFNSTLPHSQNAIGGKARFLAVITDQG